MSNSPTHIVIGNPPDFMMKTADQELMHRISFRVIASDKVIATDAVSHRSLAQSVKVIKQKLAPYGWDSSVAVNWSEKENIEGKFERTAEGEVWILYQSVKGLKVDQKALLRRSIIECFRRIYQ